MIDIKSINDILIKFERLPKVKYEPTYLDICHYSGRRFEEICSRILAFYLQPNNEHGLGNLIIKSLFETIGEEYNENFDDNITVKLEEYAGGKRLDLLILNKDWVIGIENKTGAGVYNPLPDYKERIDSYNKKNNVKIILTLNKVKNNEELLSIEKNGFKIILYSLFFEKIKYNIGKYISGSKMKYILFLYDFIETLERGEHIMSKELDSFFSENKEQLDELFELYNEYNKEKTKKGKPKLEEILKKMKEMTNSDNWSIIYDSMLLFQKEKGTIGFEAFYEEKDNDPFAIFCIRFKSWVQYAWKIFGAKLREQYPEAEYKEMLDKPFLLVYPNIDGHNDDEIINKLKECYDCIVNLKE